MVDLVATLVLSSSFLGSSFFGSSFLSSFFGSSFLTGWAAVLVAFGAGAAVILEALATAFAGTLAAGAVTGTTLGTLADLSLVGTAVVFVAGASFFAAVAVVFLAGADEAGVAAGVDSLAGGALAESLEPVLILKDAFLGPSGDNTALSDNPFTLPSLPVLQKV